MIKGEERERTRLAQELHDGIGGMLAAINMNFQVAKKRNDNFRNIRELDRIQQMIADTADEVRKTAHNLMPSILLKHTLQETLEIYCNQVNTDDQLHIDLNFFNISCSLEKSIELVLFRIVQECIQNIIKHAYATHAIVEVEQTEHYLTIVIEDNGIGFDTKEKGFGLQNLQFRIKALNGIFSITSEKNIGTTIQIKFDIEKLNNAVMA